MRPSSVQIPVIYHRVLCDQLQRRGYDCLPWLQSADLSWELIQQSDATMTLSQAERLMAAIETGSGRHDWGYVTGREIKLTTHGAVGFAMVSGATLREVANMAVRYYRLMNPLYAMSVEIEGALAVMRFRPVATMTARSRNFYEEVLAVSAYQQVLPFFSAASAPFEIRMRHPEPAHVAAFRELPRARFRFADLDEDGVSVYFDAHLLDAVNPLGDAATRALAEEICNRKIADLDKHGGWRDWVTRALRTAENSRPTQSELADLLHMSPRTLERALAREGTSFKEIYEAVGHERACELIGDRRFSISDIAQRLGYSNIGAFSRAFKRRSGVSPTEYAAATSAKKQHQSN